MKTSVRARVCTFKPVYSFLRVYVSISVFAHFHGLQNNLLHKVESGCSNRNLPLALTVEKKPRGLSGPFKSDSCAGERAPCCSRLGKGLRFIFPWLVFVCVLRLYCSFFIIINTFVKKGRLSIRIDLEKKIKLILI